MKRYRVKQGVVTLPQPHAVGAPQLAVGAEFSAIPDAFIRRAEANQEIEEVIETSKVISK